MTKDNEAYQQELEKKEKEIKELQRKFDALQIEYDHQLETAKNNENLLSFYKNQSESKASNDEAENQIKDLEVKRLMAESKNEENEETIKELNEELNKLTEEYKQLTEDKKDLNDTHDKLLNMLTEKEVENKELKEKIEGSKTEEKPSIDELNELKDTLQNLEEEYELYKIDSDSQINYQKKKKNYNVQSMI